MRKLISLLCLVFAACGGGGQPGPPVDPGPIINDPAFNFVPEVEPNDDTSTATPLEIPDNSGRTDIAAGLGSIHDTSDLIDTYSFTPNHSRRHFFQLCSNDCSLGTQIGNLDVTVANVDVLDASGNVLLSTARDSTTANEAWLAIDAGVLYYVMVIAGNTANSEQDYSINIIDDG
jgi:hypothetical protein